jgi:hypothetical protein
MVFAGRIETYCYQRELVTKLLYGVVVSICRIRGYSTTLIAYQ